MLVDLRLPPNTAAQLDDYLKQHKLFGLTMLATGEKQKCKFINKVKSRHDRFESINQFHPLVRFISSELKKTNQAYYPLVAMTVDKKVMPTVERGIYAFVVKRWSFVGLRTEEEIHSRAVLVGDNKESIYLDTDKSWELINAARVLGKDWLSAASEMDTEIIADFFDECDIRLENDYSIVKHDCINENTDRVEFQIQSSSKHRDRLLVAQKELLQRYREQGKEPLIRMTAGKINKIENKFEVQFEKLRQKSKMTSSTSDVAYGVIRVL
jgi:hypothetical protein